MTKHHCTQSTPHPPASISHKQPLTLSPDDLRACEDFVNNNINGASVASLQTLRGVAHHLLNEVIHFLQITPDSPYAGLMLQAQILLPVLPVPVLFDELDGLETDEGGMQ